MIVNIIIACIVFGYALYHLFKFLRKSTQGKCSSCGQQSSCTTEDCSANWNKTIQEAQKALH
ncbi:FeoB-associated Cys-rich membrane protein [Bacillus sp. 03113]|uniref:FeoB-associated Cys-rich membrane protein n=1 Tax=Bacillus sp. 03113 TaxID=2578211 RepID=UPI001143E637|nr:FeoB-associated Cys-rich membrane protein [Bacillus sp. 03113]